MLAADASLAGMGYAMPLAIAVGIKYRDYRNVEERRFFGGAALVSRVDDDERVGKFRHGFEAAEHRFEIGYFAIDEQALVLGKFRELALLAHRR